MTNKDVKNMSNHKAQASFKATKIGAIVQDSGVPVQGDASSQGLHLQPMRRHIFGTQ